MITHWRYEFDPDVTDAFLAGADEFVEVARKYQAGIEAKFAVVRRGNLTRLLT